MRKKFSHLLLVCVLTFLGCTSKKSGKDEVEVKAEDVQTPVAVTSISTEALSDSIELNATSSFIQDNIVKSNINGYIKAVNTKIGQFAAAGKVLFTLQTKEAKALGNTVNKLDPSFQFTGTVNVAASQSGYVTKLMHQVGDYVQDGEQLATISDSKSFGFILSIPYEYRRYITVGKTVTVLLPDGSFLIGNISSMLPTIDSASQTQTAMIKVNASMPIPENLIAKVRIVKDSKNNAVSLPKEAVLTNESQTSFWVMKMMDSVRAVKVPIIKGLETKDRIEIINPKFSATDKILLSGNYGLPDTARVKIVKTQQKQ